MHDTDIPDLWGPDGDDDLIESALPVIRNYIDGIIDELYVILLQSSATALLLKSVDISMLKTIQKFHWLRVFADKMDAESASQSRFVGRAHQRAGVPIETFIAAYHFVLARVLAAVLTDLDVVTGTRMAVALTRRVMFDISTTCSVGTHSI